MKTALTVITTALLTSIAFLLAWQHGFLGGVTILECDEEHSPQESCLLQKEGETCKTQR